MRYEARLPFEEFPFEYWNTMYFEIIRTLYKDLIFSLFLRNKYK